MARAKKSSLGAVTDNPVELIDRAIRKAHQAKSPSIELREAAELGWLAASSTADVLGDHARERPAHGFNARMKILERVEREQGLKGEPLTRPLAFAKTALHSECFHEDKCDRKTVELALNDVKKMTEIAARLKSKKRKR